MGLGVQDESSPHILLNVERRYEGCYAGCVPALMSPQRRPEMKYDEPQEYETALVRLMLAAKGYDDGDLSETLSYEVCERINAECDRIIKDIKAGLA
jgi:hypothetical protein